MEFEPAPTNLDIRTQLGREAEADDTHGSNSALTLTLTFSAIGIRSLYGGNRCS
ncbi:MAG: hypothetical protein IH808_12125 [Proteobacteria bacterium]|nr:hypothetical protein [Pseudomonadota bacterium]